MNTIRTTSQKYYWIILIILLTACSPGKTTATPGESEPDAISTQAVATVIARITPTAQTAASSETPWPTRTALPKGIMDGLRVAYSFNGNLYIQDSGGQTVQLTSSGRDYAPLLSDDGEKIVFDRGGGQFGSKQFYVINADGGQERPLVTTELLTALHLGYDRPPEPLRLAFVPGTHKLLFSTQDYSERSHADSTTFIHNNDLLLADIDSRKIRRLLAPGQASYFKVSPDGKLVWVLSGNHLDVIGLDGKLRRRLTEYPAALPDAYIAMPDMYWTQDTNKLSLVLPAPKTNYGYSGPELRTIRQYDLDGSPAVEISLNPPPLGESFSISPDGNWIVYSSYFFYGVTEKTDPFGVYLGNLREGTTRLLDTSLVPDPLAMYGVPFDFKEWSPDNAHFIFEDNANRMYMGSIDEEKIAPLNGGRFLGWLDATHYYYGGAAMGEIENDTKTQVVDLPTGFALDNTQPITYAFRKR